MNLSGPFITRSIATSLMMLALLFAGLLAFQLLPVSSLPEVDYPTMQVFTYNPGASPDVVASGITAPLERQFGQMPGLSQMTSTSSNGASVITLQFDLTMNLDVAEQEVQAAINAASGFLPTNLPTPPVYSKVNPADAPIMTLGLTSKTLSLPEVEDFAETRLAQKIAELPGVGVVSISGGQRPAVRIQANPTALSAYGLSLDTIRTVVASQNVNAAKGSFDGPRLAYTINSNDQLLTSQDYSSLILSYKNGAPIRVRDVADVINAAENVRLAAWMNTTPAVILNIQRQPNANVIAVVDRVNALLPQLKNAIPNDIEVQVVSDRTTTIRASVRDVQLELILAVLLVVAVIYIFLRSVSATIIPSIAVPLTLIGTFGAMYMMNFSLNNLTLMALTISSGFVVDDAIVMIENISRYIENGDPPMEAALKGAGQIGFTILSLTLSLIGVLIPLLFMNDVIGLLFREFALTLAVTILISAFISLTLTPMMCARMLHKEKPRKRTGFIAYTTRFLDQVVERYRTSLTWVLQRQTEVLWTAVATVLLTAFLLYVIPKGFFPVQDTGAIQGISESAQSISFAAMSEQQQALAKVVLTDPAVENLTSFIGIDGTNTTLNSGRMLITLKPLSERDASASDIIRRLQPKLAKIPGATLYMQPIQDLTIDDRVSRTQYQYSVNAPNADTVAHWSALLLKKLQQSSVLSDVASDEQNLGLQTHIQVDRDTASRLGITMQMIDDALYDAYGQRQISTMFTQRNQYYVVLEVPPRLRQGPEMLNNIYLNSASGAPVPLSAFTQVTQGVGPLVIARQGQFPVATLSFNLASNAALGDAVKVINQAQQELDMPSSVVTSFEGTAKIFQSALGNEGWLVLAAILVVYIVLGVLYESYIHPITILSTLPSAGMGALLALWITGNELSVIALIGIILLIGIVMKNAIMMIDFALEQERVYNKPPREAIYEAALLRFRPILMTTLAALFGAVPIAIGGGMGAELRQPLGIAIIGGLLFSQLLTLYTTPVIYLTFDRWARAVNHWRGIQLPGPLGEEEA